MSESIKKKIGFYSALILTIFVIISFVSSCLIIKFIGTKYQASAASAALDMAEFTINADLAKEIFSTRAVTDEYTSVQNQLSSYQKRNSSSIRRISLISFSNTSGGYIYDTGGKSLGDILEYDEYTASIKAELINGRNPLKHTENGRLISYRPIRTVDDNLCGYIIVELASPYEHRYLPVMICILAGMIITCSFFVFILVNLLNRKLFRPIKQIADYLTINDSASEAKDASVFFDTKRNDEIGRLSRALQKIFFDMHSNNEDLTNAIYDANHDGMTQLLNKRSYNCMIEMFRTCGSICLIYFDVNNLKLMNDTLGHESGDRVIIAASNYIKGILEQTDHCFRMGGDEFLLVKTECTFRKIDNIIEKLDKDCPIILSRSSDPIKCALSFGYAYSNGEYSYDELLAEAEENMYEKKAALKKELEMPER